MVRFIQAYDEHSFGAKMPVSGEDLAGKRTGRRERERGNEYLRNGGIIIIIIIIIFQTEALVSGVH